MGNASGNPTWEDYPSTNTPQSARALNAIEDALDRVDEKATRGPDPFWTAPKPGWTLPAVGMEATTTGTHVQNKLCLQAMDIRRPFTPAAFYTQVITAMVGSPDANVQLALYASDEDGWPDCTQLLAEGVLPITSGGFKTVDITDLDLPIGRYWIGGLYTFTTPPTTAPRVVVANSVDTTLPASGGRAPGGTLKGYALDNVTALPTTPHSDWVIWVGIEGFAVGLRA